MDIKFRRKLVKANLLLLLFQKNLFFGQNLSNPDYDFSITDCYKFWDYVQYVSARQIVLLHSDTWAKCILACSEKPAVVVDELPSACQAAEINESQRTISDRNVFCWLNFLMTRHLPDLSVTLKSV